MRRCLLQRSGDLGTDSSAIARARWVRAIRTIILKLRYQSKRSSVTRARLPKDFTILERLERMENQIFEIPQKSQAKFDKDSDKLYWKLLADLKKDDQDLIEYKREMDTTIVDLNYKITEANMSISGIQRLSAEMKAASSQKSQELEERMQELEAHIMDLRKAVDDVPRAPVVGSKRASVAKLEEVIPVVPVPAAAPPAQPVLVIPEVQLSPPPTVPAPAPPASAPGMSPAMGFSIDLEPRLLSIINRLNGDAMKQATGMKKTLQELEVKLDALEIATVSTEKRIIFLTSAAEAETDADNPESIKRILKNDTDLREARGQLLVIDSTLSSMLSTVKSARSDMMDMLNSPTLEEDGIMTPKDKAELDGMVELAEAFWTRLKSLEILLNTCYDHCRRHDKVYGKRWLGVVGGSSSSDTTRLIEQMATALRKYGEEIELLKEEKPSIDYVNSLIQESLSSSMSDFESKVNHMLFKLRMRNVEQMIRGEGEGGGSQESLTKKDDDDQSREDLEGMLEPLIRDIVEMYLGISQGEGGSESNIPFTSMESFAFDSESNSRPTTTPHSRGASGIGEGVIPGLLENDGQTEGVVANDGRDSRFGPQIIREREYFPYYPQKHTIDFPASLVVALIRLARARAKRASVTMTVSQGRNSSALGSRSGSRQLGPSDVTLNAARWDLGNADAGTSALKSDGSGSAPGSRDGTVNSVSSAKKDKDKTARKASIRREGGSEAMKKMRDELGTISEKIERLFRDKVDLSAMHDMMSSKADSFDLDLKADVRLLEAMERNLRNIMLEVGDLRNLHAEEIGQVKEALEKSVKKTLRVLFSSQDDQAKPTFLATKSLCLSCGRNSVVKASADPTSPPSFLPQLHAASTPGPEVYRAGFKMPVLNRESLLTAPAIGGAQRLTEAPDLTVVNSKKEEGGVGEGSSLVNVSGTDDHESVASGEGGQCVWSLTSYSILPASLRCVFASVRRP